MGVSGMQHTSFGGTGQNTAVSDTTPEVVATGVGARRVILRADPANTGDIYVGATSSVSATNGITHEPGDWSPWIHADLDGIYVLAETDGEDVQYMYDK